MNDKLTKGLVMIGSMVLAAISAGNVNWTMTLFSVILFAISYGVKNWLMPSTSTAGQFNLRDVASALILAVVAGLTDVLPTLIAGNKIMWGLVGTTVLGVVLSYFGITKVAATPSAK